MSTHLLTSEHRFWTGVWRIVDPKITLASAASLLVGTAFAARDGPLDVFWLVITVAGIFLIEAAKNASGEIFDWDSGADAAVREADRSPFSGGKRVMVDQLLSRRQTASLAAALYAAGGALGVWIALAREPRVLILGAAGVAIAFFYHAPPLKLSYRGLGELAVAVTYGPLIALGAYLVQRNAISMDLLVTSVPLGLLIAAFLWINEFPDHDADASAHKRTVVVRLGRKRASIGFALLIGAAFVLLALLPLFGLPTTIWLAAIALPPGWVAAHRLLRHPEETREIVPAQAWTLLTFLLFSIGAAAGLLVS